MATPAATPRRADAGSGPSSIPNAPRTAPAARPPATEPTRYAPAVTPHRLPRARSPSGLMLESIDSPQGDQVERTPAMRASPNPTTLIRAVAVMVPPGAVPEARTSSG